MRATYEAGPTGYGLARELAGHGLECVVAAPGKIPRAAADRVKTDRRDAEHLARLLLAGKLHPVRVPGEAEEALRDLVRAREDIRGDLMRARHRLSKLLLRHGARFKGKAWGERHRAWLARVELGEPAAQATLTDYRGAIEALLHRRADFERQIEALIPASPWQRGRPAAVPARHRHAVGGRALRRDRRLRPLRQRRPARELRRARPLRALKRRATPPRVDHQDRLAPRPAATRRGRLALPRPAPPRTHARATPAGPTGRRDRDQLVGTAASEPHLDTPACQGQASDPRRGRGRARALRLLLGKHDHGGTALSEHAVSAGGRWPGRWPSREGIRVTPMGTRSARPAIRSRPSLDSGPHDETRSCGHPNPRISV